MANRSTQISPQRKRMMLLSASLIIVLCTAWLGWLFRDTLVPPPVAKAPDSPRDRTAAEVQAKLREDSRFDHIDVIPDPQSTTGYLVTGDLKKAPDQDALKSAVATISPGNEFRFDTYVMK